MAKNKEKKEKGQSGGAKLVIIAVVMALLAAGLGVAGGYYYLSKTKGNTNTNLNNTNSAEELRSTYTTSLGDDFLLNLADQDSKRLIKAKISIGYDSKKLTTELADASTIDIVRDTINSVLRSKTAADFSDEKAVDKVKKEILDRINPLFQDGKANNVYFPQIIIQ